MDGSWPHFSAVLYLCREITCCICCPAVIETVNTGMSRLLSGLFLHFNRLYINKNETWPRKIPQEFYINSWRRHFWGRAVAQAVSCRPFTPKTRIWSQPGPREICSVQSGNGAGFTRSTSVFSWPCLYTNIPYLYGYFISLTLSFHNFSNRKRR